MRFIESLLEHHRNLKRSTAHDWAMLSRNAHCASIGWTCSNENDLGEVVAPGTTAHATLLQRQGARTRPLCPELSDAVELRPLAASFLILAIHPSPKPIRIRCVLFRTLPATAPKCPGQVPIPVGQGLTPQRIHPDTAARHAIGCTPSPH